YATETLRISDLGPSVARLWDEQLLDAIRIDIPKPPVHARNLFHLSVAMWDAWAAYDPVAIGYVVTEKHTAEDVEAARAEAISYGQVDGSNDGEGLCYPDDTGYTPVNPELIFKLPGVGTLADPNRWQPLAFDYYVTQNGIPIGQAIQRFVGVGWADVSPFALV